MKPSSTKKRSRSDSASDDIDSVDEWNSGKVPDGGTSASYLDPRDILPSDSQLKFWIEVDSPAFLRRGVLMARPMLDTITLWLSNNMATYNAAKAKEEETGEPCSIRQFCGISIDSMDTNGVSMTVARMPQPPSSVHLFGDKPTDPVPDEIGITVMAKPLWEALQGVKEYPKMIIYSEKTSDRLSIAVVSTAHDMYLSEIPLCSTLAEHETVKNWDMKFDLSMPMSDLKDTIKRAVSLNADNVHFQMMKWSEHGFVFAISTESRCGGFFRAFQVTYTTPLKKNLTAEVNYALEKVNERRALYNAADPGAKSSAALLEGIAEAENQLKGHLMTFYDKLETPAGFTKPARDFGMESDLPTCENGVRELQSAVRDYRRSSMHEDATVNAAGYVDCLDAKATVEVATSFSKEIRTAPLRKADIMALPVEYDAWFSVKKLQDMVKTPQSSGVQLHLPKHFGSPLALRFDTGGGDFMSFVSFILAPRVDQDA